MSSITPRAHKNGKTPINLVNPSGRKYNGLTKREHLAGLAMQGIMANEFLVRDKPSKGIAMRAVELADALLEELE